MTKKQSYYIGWRGNRQLSRGGYYKAFGQLSKRDARKKEDCVYGSMSLMAYASEAEYQAALAEHKAQGYSVYSA